MPQENLHLRRSLWWRLVDTITNFLDLNKELQRTARLLQSAITPFMQSPLQQQVLTFEDTSVVDQIMEGTYEPP
jgi:hypothetical protein